MRVFGRVRSRLGYANVVATIALFVGLGGASYAAVALPADSVGTRQLKDQAVISAKVKDGSLLARDFAAGQLSAGPRGPRGLTGARGLRGPVGRGGAAISARPRFVGSVDVPDHGVASIPLTSNHWSQGPSELDFGPFGSITYTSPDSSSCGGAGGAALQVDIYVDCKLFSVKDIEALRDGSSHTAGFVPTDYLFEPGGARAHTATATVSSVCDSSSLPAPFRVNALSFDIVRAT